MSGALGSIDMVDWEALEATIRESDNGSLLAQACVQKGALHALVTLLRRGCTEREAQAMRDGCAKAVDVIDEECRRRGLGTIKDPRAI